MIVCSTMEENCKYVTTEGSGFSVMGSNVFKDGSLRSAITAAFHDKRRTNVNTRSSGAQRWGPGIEITDLYLARVQPS